jgi:cobaltochelatase CobN
LRDEGIDEPEAWRRAGYRIFGSKPGTYGAGILQLLDEKSWRTDADLAATYVNWGGYAYTRESYGVDARGAFREALAQVNVAVKNQDNREHDIFDSDDYLQFHGGMIASIRALTGQNPRAYFGDTQDPDRPLVRTLKDEANRVFRSRVVNPKWIASIQQHGYKGALEVAATVDYLYGYDATAQVVDDWQYERAAQALLLDPTMQDFLSRSNPWAMRDIAERLHEAIERGLWAAPSEEMIDAIKQAYLKADGDIEDGGPVRESAG